MIATVALRSPPTRPGRTPLAVDSDRPAASAGTLPSGRMRARRRSCGSLAARTGLDRQQAVGDLPVFRWRLLERAEPASTKRRLLLHLRLSGSLAAAREQVAASGQEQSSCSGCWFAPDATARPSSRT